MASHVIYAPKLSNDAPKFCVELSNILDLSSRNKMFNDYFDLEQKLGGSGASENTASLIISK